MICLMIQERKKNECVKMSLKCFSCEKEMTGNVIKIGIPGALITVMMSVANIVLNNFIGIYGSDAVASYGIAYKIDMFPIMLSVGLSQGTAPLVNRILGVINMVTAYFQALGKALNSLMITLLRNVVLFIPGVVILNYFFKLNGVILTQLIVEIILTAICLIMYMSNQPNKVLKE